MNKSMIKPDMLSCRFFLFLAFVSVFVPVNNLSAAASFLDITWQWSSLVEEEPASQSDVPKPENYMLTFREGGALQIKADCNMVHGSYSIEDNKLSITLGPSTMAACEDQSLDTQFLGLLGRVESFTLENDQLKLKLKGENSRMTFSK